jgi:D-arabinose 5-phosphate isomerase GutQ
MLLLISGSGKTASVEMIIKSASKTPIYIITSQKLPSKHFQMVIATKGQNKMNNELSVLPLGSSFEINAFLYLECIIAKIIGDYPPAKDEIRKIYQKYYQGKMIVF